MKLELSSAQAGGACTHHPTAHPGRWLVVDDNENLLDLLVLLLRELTTAEIWSFTSPVKALAAFAADPGAFQFVITDFDMPGLNGNELCQLLHQLAPGLKILLTTGSTVITKEDARQNGFCGLIPKPFPPGALELALQAAGVLDTGTRAMAC